MIREVVLYTDRSDYNYVGSLMLGDGEPSWASAKYRYPNDLHITNHISYRCDAGDEEKFFLLLNKQEI